MAEVTPSQLDSDLQHHLFYAWNRPLDRNLEAFFFADQPEKCPNFFQLLPLQQIGYSNLTPWDGAIIGSIRVLSTQIHLDGPDMLRTFLVSYMAITVDEIPFQYPGIIG